MTYREETANIILRQLGGNKFIAMTGARNFVALKDGIKFHIGRNNSKANVVEITLNGKDLYDMQFVRQIKPTMHNKFMGERHPIMAYNDCYCEQLQTIFKQETGLNTHL